MKQSSYKIKSIPSLLPLWGTGGFSLHCVAGLLGALLLWLFPLWLPAQTTGKNYIISTVPFQAVSDPTTLVDANSNTAIQYFDGLGRPIQTVQRGITPLGADLVTGIMYDSYGRDSLKWLPAVAGGNNGAYYPNFAAQAVSSNGDDKPYSHTEYEPSPLNRVTGQYGAGADWYSAGKKQTIEYLANDANIACYYVTSDKHLAKDANYAAGSLYVTKATDEDGKTGYEFKDKQGRVILKRQILGGDNVDTYYVYNDLGQLCYVLPPKAVDELTSADLSDDNAVMKQYCYLYRYDERGNNIYKRRPGCEPIYMVYDKADRLVLSQDGNQRAKSPVQWTVIKYEQLGRVIFTGLTNSITSSQTDLISSYKNDLIVETFSSGAYSNNKFSDATPLTVNYYDTYGFVPALPTAIKTGLTYADMDGYDKPYPQSPPSGDLGVLNAKGFVTGTLTYHLNDSTKYEITALYYDKYGRVVQTRATNHLGGYNLVYNALDFTGKPTKTLKNHNIAGQASVVELYTYVYDKAQRMLTTTLSLNGGDVVTLVSNTYDDLGRLYSKNLGGADATTYTYNVRSWTTGINGSRFTENLYYNNGTLNGASPRYNGNIAAMQWNLANDSLQYNRAYGFTYDDLNRLTNADYYGFSNGSVISGTTGLYSESFGFDKMGNITNFVRYGLQSNNSTLIYDKIDDLTLEHTGNQLMRVTDTGSNGIFYGNEEFVQNGTNTGNSCAYDANGNRQYDSNSNIWGIRYNTLNLPDAMQFYQGHQTNYTYSAAGAKLKVIDKTAPAGAELPVTSLNTILTNPSVSMTTTTDYVGNIIYENGTLKRILTSVGYWQAGTFYYFLKDHLGSNRVVITGSGGIAETSSYYPSGMRFGESAVNGSSIQPYRHTGMEMQEMHGLNWIDNLARFRTVSDGSGFTGVDILAEKKPWMSPYVYCSGNPINRIDPDGRADIYGVNPQKQTDFGVMLVLPSSFRKDKVLQADFDNAQKNKVPIMVVDNIADFKDGLSTLKDEKVNVNAYSISQHGTPGTPKIGDDKLDLKTDFSPLKDGLSGKNVMFSQCSVTENNNEKGISILTSFSNTTNANATVTADQTVPGGNVLGSQNNSAGGNDFHLISPTKTNGQPKQIYNFEIKANGTFVWTNNDVNTSNK